jgi:Methyltransferase FkbM domain
MRLLRWREVDLVIDVGANEGQQLYLKLDTQGTELSILRGASRALLDAEFVEAELSPVRLYDGGALFDEVIGFLDDRGFALVSLEGIDEEPKPVRCSRSTRSSCAAATATVRPRRTPPPAIPPPRVP